MKTSFLIIAASFFHACSSETSARNIHHVHEEEIEDISPSSIGGQGHGYNVMGHFNYKNAIQQNPQQNRYALQQQVDVVQRAELSKRKFNNRKSREFHESDDDQNRKSFVVSDEPHPPQGVIFVDPKTYQQQVTNALSALIHQKPQVQLLGLKQLLEQTEGIQREPEQPKKEITQAYFVDKEKLANIQAELNRVAHERAQKTLNEAQQRALAHVQAQHRAIALAQVQAQEAAMKNFVEQNLHYPQVSVVKTDDSTAEEEISQAEPEVQSHIEIRTNENQNNEAKANEDTEKKNRYAFGYRIMDLHEHSDFGHEEQRNGRSTKGHYHVLLPDGRLQKVDYYADDTGYHAKVTYEHVGTN